MKKVFSFMRSMRFGMILLILVMACSLIGSLIPQGEPAMRYVRAYGAGNANLLLAVGFTDIFHTWYFIGLEVLLCLNLILCSILRFPSAMRHMETLKKQAKAKEEMDFCLAPGEAERIREHLLRMHFHKQDSLYTKNGTGAYGSFLVHLSILMVLLFGSLALLTPQVKDQTVMPESSLTLEDGTVIECLSFHIEDGDGRLDYASVLRITSPDGRTTREQEIRVNEPMTFGGYKIYQQTYGTAGRLTARNLADGTEDTFTLTEPCFLSIDSKNGIYYNALYPGYVEEEDGSYTLITSTALGYGNPVYSIESITDGSAVSVLAFPGETMQIGDITFTFKDPVEYPGLRIKHVSLVLYGFLYFSFGLMVAALYLTFFRAPVCVRVEEDGYCIVSGKSQEGLEIALQTLISKQNEPGGTL